MQQRKRDSKSTHSSKNISKKENGLLEDLFLKGKHTHRGLKGKHLWISAITWYPKMTDSLYLCQSNNFSLLKFEELTVRSDWTSTQGFTLNKSQQKQWFQSP